MGRAGIEMFLRSRYATPRSSLLDDCSFIDHDCSHLCSCFFFIFLREFFIILLCLLFEVFLFRHTNASISPPPPDCFFGVD